MRKSIVWIKKEILKAEKLLQLELRKIVDRNKTNVKQIIKLVTRIDTLKEVLKDE